MNIVTSSRLDISQPPRRRVLSPDTAPCSGSSPSPPHEASGIKSNPQINGNNLQIIVFIIDCQLPSDPQRRLLLLYKKAQESISVAILLLRLLALPNRSRTATCRSPRQYMYTKPFNASLTRWHAERQGTTYPRASTVAQSLTID